MTHITYRVNLFFSSHGQRISLYISVIFLRLSLVKPVSHQPCGSRAPVYEHTFGVFLAAASRPSYVSQGRKAVATSYGEFSTCSFSLRFSADVWRSQGSLEMTARLTYEFAPSDTWAAANQSLRLSHEGRRVNARTTCGCLAFDARLSQECYEAYDSYKPSHSSCTVALRQT